VQKLAAEIGASFTIDPTITPHINGDRSLLRLNIDRNDLREIMNDKTIAGEDQFIAVAPGDEDVMEASRAARPQRLLRLTVRATSIHGVQFPLPSGNVRQQKFIDIWKYSPQL